MKTQRNPAFLFLGPSLAVLLLAGPLAAGPFTLQETWTGEAVGDQFGFAVAPVGDVDGDGFDDVAVGANVNDHLIQSGGRAYLFRGGPGYPPNPSLDFAGDVQRGYLGGAVAGGADLNGDGFADWAVGSPGPGPDGLFPGRVDVFFGGPAADFLPDLVLEGTVAGGQFGAALALLPDWDGDGYGDLAVGSPRAGDGQVAVFRGGPGGPAALPDRILHARPDDLRFGKSLGVLADRTGDGRDELLVGAPRSSEAATWAGAVLVYEGSAVLDTVPDLVLLGETAGEEFGYSLCAAGDVDGDGRPDILVGAPFANGNGLIDAGGGYVFDAGPGLDAVPELRVSGTTPYERFGTSVALGFDWNGDGWGDAAFGAPNRSTALNYAGAVDVLFGGAALDTLTDATVDGPAPDLHLGTTLAPGGDLLDRWGTSLCLGGYNAVNEGIVLLYGRDPGSPAAVPAAPAGGRLLPPWPNPANPRVSFTLDVAAPGAWRITIVDLAGRLLKIVHDGRLPAGAATWSWDGTDRAGRPVASGVYGIRAESATDRHRRSITLVR